MAGRGETLSGPVIDHRYRWKAKTCQSGAAVLSQLDEGAMEVLRTDVNIWLDDDRGQLPGTCSTCKRAGVVATRAIMKIILLHFL